MKKDLVRSITNNAIIAAIYFLLTLISFPISFGLIQVRIAEALVLLCFFNCEYAFGITIGCLLANLLGPGNLGLFDVVFGTLATFASCLLISLFKHLALAGIVPVILNSFTVGSILYFVSENEHSYFAIVGILAIGEIIAIYLVGYLLFRILKNNKKFFELIKAKKNIEFKW